MRKNIKIMLVAAAVVAISALTAASAFGTKGEWDFGCEVKVCHVTGEQVTGFQNVFTVNGGTVKCTVAKFAGTAEGTLVGSDWLKHEMTIAPTYTGCTAFGQNATVTTTGCHFDFTPTSTTDIDLKHITCEAGKSIVVKATTAGCTVTVGSQTPTGTNGTLDATEEGTTTTRDILFASTVKALKYTSSGGICGASGENGVYTGSVTMKGYSNAAHTTHTGIFLKETTS